jgi:hypothetical protein
LGCIVVLCPSYYVQYVIEYSWSDDKDNGTFLTYEKRRHPVHRFRHLSGNQIRNILSLWAKGRKSLYIRKVILRSYVVDILNVRIHFPISDIHMN